MQKAKWIAVLGMAVAIAVLVPAAHADTITVNDVLYTATVTSTTVTLTVQCQDGGVCGGYYLGAVSLKGFTFTGSPTDTSGTEPGVYSVQNGGANNGIGGGCNGTQLGSAVCWSLTGTPTAIGGTTYTFSADITGGSVGSDGLHLQTTAYDNPDEGHSTRVFAISSDLTGGNITVPEPSALSLLGAGLLGIFGLSLRRKKVLA